MFGEDWLGLGGSKGNCVTLIQVWVEMSILLLPALFAAFTVSYRGQSR